LNFSTTKDGRDSCLFYTEFFLVSQSIVSFRQLASSKPELSTPQAFIPDVPSVLKNLFSFTLFTFYDIIFICNSSQSLKMTEISYLKILKMENQEIKIPKRLFFIWFGN
jgi:hypothetical protein